MATEEVVGRVDQTHAKDDADYAKAVLDFHTAKGVLAKARVARGFFPVVVPADFKFPSGKGQRRKGNGK